MLVSPFCILISIDLLICCHESGSWHKSLSLIYSPPITNGLSYLSGKNAEKSCEIRLRPLRADDMIPL